MQSGGGLSEVLFGMKKMLLIAPSLHQGGAEKVCAMTARLLQPYFEVQIAIFDSRNIDYE